MTIEHALLPVVEGEHFFAVDMRVGVVVAARVNEAARKPAYVVEVDFGPAIGVRKTSAQITVRYTPEELVGRKVVGWVNAPRKQIGPVMSEFLLLGAYDAAGAVNLLVPEGGVEAGARVC